MKRKSKYFWYESKLYGANYTKALDCDANMEECDVRYVSVLQVSQSLSLSSPACFPPNLHTCKQIFGVYNDLDEVLFAFLNHSTKLSFLTSSCILQWLDPREANCMPCTPLFTFFLSVCVFVLPPPDIPGLYEAPSHPRCNELYLVQGIKITSCESQNPEKIRWSAHVDSCYLQPSPASALLRQVGKHIDTKRTLFQRTEI